jgi:hypothetical protein
MRCAHKSDTATVCVKLKAVSKLIAIYLYKMLVDVDLGLPGCDVV